MIHIPFLFRFSGDVKTKESRSISYDYSGYEVLMVIFQVTSLNGCVLAGYTYTYLLNIFNSIFIMNQEWPIIGTICVSFFSLFIPLEWNRNANFSNTDNSNFIMKNIAKRVKKPSLMWILKFPA